MPKAFNLLLLAIGFIMLLLGVGWLGYRQDSSYVYLGLGVMLLAIFLEIREKKTAR